MLTDKLYEMSDRAGDSRSGGVVAYLNPHIVARVVGSNRRPVLKRGYVGVLHALIVGAITVDENMISGRVHRARVHQIYLSPPDISRVKQLQAPDEANRANGIVFNV
ncbi:hypothetical protein [Burkholderia ubonensis]|uniref:hypothetical protein n=1 Tax=Burkholderia ubonensis TaxID=101571 RepID=UPI0012FA2967|nr:hypothetical protein [Burkholderia ubonensis]